MSTIRTREDKRVPKIFHLGGLQEERVYFERSRRRRTEEHAVTSTRSLIAGWSVRSDRVRRRTDERRSANNANGLFHCTKWPLKLRPACLSFLPSFLPSIPSPSPEGTLHRIPDRMLLQRCCSSDCTPSIVLCPSVRPSASLTATRRLSEVVRFNWTLCYNSVLA